MSEQPQLSEAARRAIARRERQKAKLATGGANRLASIASLAGRPKFAEATMNESATSTGTSTPRPTENVSPNPSTGARSRQMSPLDNRDQQAPFPFLGQPSAAGGQSVENMDPNALLQAMMMSMSGMNTGEGAGSAGQVDPQGGPDMGGLPPGIAEMLGGMLSQSQQGGPQGFPGMQKMPASPAAAQQTKKEESVVWKVCHAVCSFALAFYIALQISFTGSLADREQLFLSTGPVSPFMIFVTMEVILQSTRFALERGQHQGNEGMLATVISFVPPPYNNYIRTAIRYKSFYNQFVADSLFVVFALGCISVWKGGSL